jgi:UDP-glucose-4-epimerase GalE
MKLLIVGGAGYIGSHMLLALQDAGVPASGLLVFDNLSRGHADACGSVEIFRGDLRNTEDLTRCFKKFTPDLVMHFGALAYVGESVDEPLLYYENNVVGSLNLLATMRMFQVSRLVFSSTCATYGEPQTLPIPEDHPQHPINPYGRTKLMIEQALIDYGHAYGLRSISLRYFNAAGADPQGRARERHEPETHLIPLVLREAARIAGGGDPGNTTLKVFGTDFDTPDGSCVRDYIHVEDLCAAHLAAAQALMQTPLSTSAAREVTNRPVKTAAAPLNTEFFNLANGNGYSVFEVINACKEVTGQPIEAQIVGRRAGDPARLIGNAEKIRGRLGWAPKKDLKAILKDAWEAKSF